MSCQPAVNAWHWGKSKVAGKQEYTLRQENLRTLLHRREYHSQPYHDLALLHILVGNDRHLRPIMIIGAINTFDQYIESAIMQMDRAYSLSDRVRSTSNQPGPVKKHHCTPASGIPN